MTWVPTALRMIRVPPPPRTTWACTFAATMVRVAALIESASSFMGVIRCEGLSLDKAKHGAAPLCGPRDDWGYGMGWCCEILRCADSAQNDLRGDSVRGGLRGGSARNDRSADGAGNVHGGGLTWNDFDGAAAGYDFGGVGAENHLGVTPAPGWAITKNRSKRDRRPGKSHQVRIAATLIV
jgi:hypothetical protein